MKNPRDMSKLELEQEVIESRNSIKKLHREINNLKYQLIVYKDFIEEHKSKTLSKRKDWYE